MNGHLYQQLRSQTMKSQTMRSNWLYEKPGCDVHEELKCLEFTEHFSCAVHVSSVRQAGAGITTRFTYRETDALQFKRVSPLEKQNSKPRVIYSCLTFYSSDLKIRKEN